MTYIVYSHNGEEYNDHTEQDVIMTLVNQLDHYEVYVGAELSYHKAEAVKFKPSDFVRVDSILEDLQCQADDEGGEYAEDFTYCSKEAQDELDKLVSDWADKHLDCHFYRVRNSVEVPFIVTKEMYEELMA